MRGMVPRGRSAASQGIRCTRANRSRPIRLTRSRYTNSMLARVAAVNSGSTLTWDESPNRWTSNCRRPARAVEDRGAPLSGVLVRSLPKAMLGAASIAHPKRRPGRPPFNRLNRLYERVLPRIVFHDPQVFTRRDGSDDCAWDLGQDRGQGERIAGRDLRRAIGTDPAASEAEHRRDGA